MRTLPHSSTFYLFLSMHSFADFGEKEADLAENARKLSVILFRFLLIPAVKKQTYFLSDSLNVNHSFCTEFVLNIEQI